MTVTDAKLRGLVQVVYEAMIEEGIDSVSLWEIATDHFENLSDDEFDRLRAFADDARVTISVTWNK